MQCEYIQGGKLTPGNSLNVWLSNTKCSCLVKCRVLGVCTHELMWLVFQQLKNIFEKDAKSFRLCLLMCVDVFWPFLKGLNVHLRFKGRLVFNSRKRECIIFFPPCFTTFILRKTRAWKRCDTMHFNECCKRLRMSYQFRYYELILL